MEVRVRFAPSPTGPFSLGNARTALFNWLFARHEGGKFLLRIEDTDKARSKKEYEEGILRNLRWLGLDWDEPEVRQSERLDLYEQNLNQLMKDHKAYWCFCTAEELDAERQAQLSQGILPRYGGRCRNLSADIVQEKLKTQPAVIRFRMPDKVFAFTDMVRGKVEFNVALSGDIVIAKGMRDPLYNFAVVVDDHAMRISHVIRGEDHLSNTPKQLAIQEALGLPHPHYAHLPLILGPDKKKLSKRFLAASVDDFRAGGYLPHAIVNFLALLGWHPTPDREIIAQAEIVKEFEIRRVQKGGAIYNEDKLNWLNAHYIKTLPPEELVAPLSLFIPDGWKRNIPFLVSAISAERDRMRRLTDFSKLAQFFFELPAYAAELLVRGGATRETTLASLKNTRAFLEAIPDADFTEANLNSTLMAFADAHGRGAVLWPLRAALSGEAASPGPQSLLHVFGKPESLRRIDVAIQKLI